MCLCSCHVLVCPGADCRAVQDPNRAYVHDMYTVKGRAVLRCAAPLGKGCGKAFYVDDWLKQRVRIFPEYDLPYTGEASHCCVSAEKSVNQLSRAFEKKCNLSPDVLGETNKANAGRPAKPSGTMERSDAVRAPEEQVHIKSIDAGSGITNRESYGVVDMASFRSKWS